MKPVPGGVSDFGGVEACLRQARQLLGSGQTEKAHVVCWHLHGQGCRDARLFRLLGLIHHGQGDLERAGDFFAEAIQLAPHDPILYYNYGTVLIEQGRSAEAISPLTTALRLRPQFAEVNLALGNIAMAGNRPAEAVVHYLGAIQPDQPCGAANYNLAMAYMQLELWSEASEALARAAAASPEDIDTLSQLGGVLERQGRLREAARVYAQALAIVPEHLVNLERLSGVLVGLDEPLAAIEQYRKILLLQPNNYQVMNNLGLLLQRTGRHDEAIRLYRQALAVAGDVAALLFNLANALVETGAREEAIPQYQQAIRVQANFRDAWFNLGVTYQQLHRYAEAETAYCQVIAMETGNSPESYFSLAVVQQAQQRLDEAIRHYGMVVRLDPTHVLARYNMGIALSDVGRYAEAVASFRGAHTLDPVNVKVLNNLGLALHDHGDFDAAAEVFRQAIALQADFADAFANLGNTRLAQGREEEALAAYNQALRCNPGFAKAYYNLGCLHIQRNDPDTAIAMYRQAIDRDPQLVEAHWNLSNALLLRGEFAEGFREYRWRWRRKKADVIVLPLPEWGGEVLPNATLLVVTEQGKGDTFQFVRYLPLVKKRVGRIIFVCEQSLRSLMASMPVIDLVVSRQEAAAYCSEATCYAPLLNLPDILGEEGVPNEVPYLSPDPGLVSAYSRLFVGLQGQRKVGVVWRGNPGHGNDHNRSCRPTDLLPLTNLPGITLFSLQKEAPAGETLPGAIDLAPHLHSFADTAAVMAHLDLIVSVDTSVIHLAGALARPVWTMLPLVPDWRWLLHRDDSPWYPTMRLFRQSATKNWSEVVAAVCDQLCRSSR